MSFKKEMKQDNQRCKFAKAEQIEKHGKKVKNTTKHQVGDLLYVQKTNLEGTKSKNTLK